MDGVDEENFEVMRASLEGVDVITFLVCRRCGCLVGDQKVHMRTHPQEGPEK